MPENLTQLEDGRWLVIGDQLLPPAGSIPAVALWPGQAAVVVDDSLLSSLPELVRLREEVERLRDALTLAKQEIDWWVDEHSCCKGHETGVVTAIDAALSSDGGSPYAPYNNNLDYLSARETTLMAMIRELSPEDAMAKLSLEGELESVRAELAAALSSDGGEG